MVVRGNKPRRNIILPQEISEKLDLWTKGEQEINGSLFYRLKPNLDCPVEGLYLMTVGDAGHVGDDQGKIRVANAFIENHPEYIPIKFHTHTIRTIEKFGPYYASNFSQGDTDYIKQQLEHNKWFIELLVTPETKLLAGRDNPTLTIRKLVPEYESNHKWIEGQISHIARELGIKHEGMEIRFGKRK